MHELNGMVGGRKEPFDVQRPASDLSHPVTDGDTVRNAPQKVQDLDAVREQADSSVRYLTLKSLKPAVLLARTWQVKGVPFAFEHLDLYREVAAASGCSIIEIERPEAGGLEHLVFAARIAGLSDEEYLNCIEDKSEAKI